MGRWRSQRCGKTAVWDAIVEEELGQLRHSAEEQMELGSYSEDRRERSRDKSVGCDGEFGMRCGSERLKLVPWLSKLERQSQEKLQAAEWGW